MKRVIISGGGTGGHIFPALAIANEIRSRYPAAEILFAGALGRMEMEKIPAAGYKIIGLPVTGFPRKPGMKLFSFAWGLIKSNLMAKKLIQEFNPQIAIGVGGFASGPVLRAAAQKGIPTLIQEQNSYAGITNKLLAKKANVICVAYDGMDRYFPASKIIHTGNPVRENLLKHADNRQEAFDYFGLKKNEKVVLIVGGSLGARSVNEAVMKNMEVLANSGVEFIWQTGSIYYKDILANLENKLPSNLHVYEFISRMDLAYAAATVVISRAGAGTISELCLVAKPSILVPSPNVAEDHQTKNALALEREGAAVLVPDNEIQDNLLPEAISLVKSPERCRQLSEKIKLLAKPKATIHIVDEVEKLLGI
jgi:UDP-N-acetylglucosamine--N-acetylmuramyl-(pentapeptide) pyrophosphoryl-undecaprenol N-acetylglucosamine transferase